jgi:Ca2+-binding RTX toxin-like protein
MTRKFATAGLATLLVAAASGFWALVPARALAASETVSVSAGTLTVRGAAGLANNITVDGYDANNYSVIGASPVAGAGRTQPTTTNVHCPKASVRRILVVAGDRNDNVTVEDTTVRLSARLLGGTGNDHLVGGGGPDYLHGGLGADRFQGRAGNDVLAARDFLRDTWLQCDSGSDTLYTDWRDPRIYMLGCERILRPPRR